MYSILVEKFGPFCIDLFASRLNYKEPKYVSWKPDPLALFVDAFSRSWNDFNKFYAFPPFSLILSCIHKITTDKARGVLIIPLWPTQSWFPKILGMLVAEPLLLPKNVLNLPFRPAQTHNLNNSLYLLACPLSGIISETKAFQKHAVDILCHSWRASTVKQYEIYYKKWHSFCNSREADPSQYNETLVVEYLGCMTECRQTKCRQT